LPDADGQPLRGGVRTGRQDTQATAVTVSEATTAGDPYPSLVAWEIP
jgi:hypothetical protein